MTVQELIDLLQDECDPEATVMMALQKHYPLESFVEGLHKAPGKVYIVEGTQQGYGPDKAWEDMI